MSRRKGKQSMPDGIRGMTVVLAGGSGGLGSAATALLAEEGAKLVVSYRENRARAEQLSTIATVVQADITSADDRRRLLDAAPGLGALAVFTGTAARVPDFEEALAFSTAVNFTGPLMLAREAAARMRE